MTLEETIELTSTNIFIFFLSISWLYIIIIIIDKRFK